jgi:hypothetical protein
VAFHSEVVLERCDGRLTFIPKGRIGTFATAYRDATPAR